ncbi:MAG: serine/threonine-protein phosphatase [Planctomycetes bacterium]|nr:serine/threonine-protein phosphatase [Planctomycetota bacterium]
MGPSQRELLKKKFWFVWGAATNKGRQREGNEDAFATAADTGLFLVSDGMGGHQGGEIASQIVADDLPVMIEAGLENLRSHSVNSIRRYLKRSVAAQSEHLRMEAENGDGHKEMGATVVVLLIAADRAYIASAGDSRVYLLRDEILKQVTKDQSTVEELIDAGEIERHEAQDHPAAGEITNYMGMEKDEIEPFVKTFEVAESDRFLLCSDGLTDMLDDDAIAELLRTEDDSQDACVKLIRKANYAGGHDNITVVVVDIIPA